MKKLKLSFFVAAAVTAFVACNEDTAPKREFNPEKPGEEVGTTYYSDPSIFTATPDANGDLFEPLAEFSSEFDDNHDATKWEMVEEAYQSWIFKSRDENIKIEDGKLHLTLKTLTDGAGGYITELGKNGTPCYIGSGMLRSVAMVDGYGYYEAKIKGSDLWQGSCPSFWLYSRGAEGVTYKEGDVTYNEIDIIEINQVPADKHIMSCNLHLGIANNKGVSVTKKAGQYLKMGRNEYLVDFETEDDYHIYGCENRPDSVVFYLDNKRVAARPNFFHHMQNRMFLTLSLGVRTPFEYYDENGKRIAVDPNAVEPNPNTDLANSTQGDVNAGSTMIVEYVRSFTRKDGYAKFRNNSREWVEAEFKN